MTTYIIRRLLIMPITLMGVTFLIFAMMQILGPVERSALYVRDVPKTENQINAIIERYGLADPIHFQYWYWLVGRQDPQTGDVVGGILRGDLGFSRTGREPVIDMLQRRFPATLELALWAMIPIIAGGIWMGMKAALNHNRPVDQVSRVFATLGWSIPTFVLGLLLLLIFYARLGWFAPGRLSTQFALEVTRPGFIQYTKMMTVDALLNLRFDIFIDALTHLVMPVITLAVIQWALLLRVTRSSMLEEMRQDYVRTARSKGLKERTVVNRHIRRNALIPVVTIAGATLAGLMNGAVVTETIFNYPGLGQMAAEAAVTLDVITMLGFALFNGILFIGAYLIVDILYVVIDPRIRLS
ncbi:MAG: ABC transporter permease [Chloroflexi bacterium]|nr:ABC transporter permease [Ardenticatenaceae bacterium]MBL1127570.1 ABC transporter permease [Chloroflexota bacterium]NOG33635.1 ABC transporter permease [Chloroflexota bacterium]GIK56593.1 MAG: peptide ABC transporter permease [Chloroflexota bacterium]